MTPEGRCQTGAVLSRLPAGWPGLALLAFWLPTLQPLTQPGQMPCSFDGILHLLRAFHLDELMRQGLMWPRWAPEMAFGYGYPLFNFYPLLSLYPVLLLERLGLGLLQANNLALALSLLACGAGMYLWARAIIGPGGAFVAGVAYMFAPYALYTVYWRVSLAEALALPLLPLALWCAWRLSQTGGWRYALAGALVYAAVSLTHAVTGLIFSLLLPFYTALLVWHAPQRRRAAFQLLSMIVVGLGLAAFFLIPAYLERDQVQLWRAFEPAGLDYHYHFLSLGDLFGVIPANDPTLLNPAPVRTLGALTGLLAALGALGLIWKPAGLGQAARWHVVWAGLGLLGTVSMSLPISEPVWARAPLLPAIQFPWRFLGLGCLLAGLLAGIGATVLEKLLERAAGGLASGDLTRRVPLVAGACAAVLAASAYPLLYPRQCPMPNPPDRAFYAMYEEGTGFIGATCYGEYLPTGVQELPTTSPLVAPMRAGQPLNRWDAPGVRILEAYDDGLKARLVFENEAASQVVYRAFYFPGWHARLDEQPAALSALPPLGLMAVNVPASQAGARHILEIAFESTPLRMASAAASLVFGGLALAMGWLDLARAIKNARDASSHSLAGSKSTKTCPQSLSVRAWLSLAALGLLLAGLKLSVFDRYDTPLRWQRLKDGQFKRAVVPNQAIIAAEAGRTGQVRLLGHSVQPQPATAGEVVYVDLYWTQLEEEALKFRSTLRLLDADGLEWSAKHEVDTALIGFIGPSPSKDWPTGMYADDRHAIRVLAGAPPGDYDLVVVPFNPNTIDPLPLASGPSAGGDYPGLVVGKLEVTRPAHPPVPEAATALELAVAVDSPLGEDLKVVGYSQDRAEAAPGDGMRLEIGWQAGRRPRQDYTARLELLAADGQVAAQATFAPGGARYPTSAWPAGDSLTSQHLVRVSGRAESGQHTWQVTLLDGQGQSVGQAQLGHLDVAAPQRSFSQPPTAHQVEVHLGEWVSLVGYDFPSQAAADQAISITLVWRARQETEQDYKVFVHLLDAGGQLAAQSDAAPANWTRPTSGWRAGEFVSDDHTLALRAKLPPGEYRLVVGMYGEGGRLLTGDGKDGVELGQMVVR